MHEMTAALSLSRFLGSGSTGQEGASFAALKPDDWQQLVLFAEKQRLAQQLYIRLEAAGICSVMPEQITEKLKGLYISGSVRGVRLSYELSTILQKFKAEGVPVIVLKGPHLAEKIYGDWGLRPMEDFDLLVRQQDIGRSVSLLKGLSYNTWFEPAHAGEVTAHPHYPVLAKEGRFFVELHFALAAPEGPFSIDIDGVWGRAQRTIIAGSDALVLSNEDLLLHLCIHAAYNHSFSLGLLPLMDIGELLRVRGDSLDWDEIKRRSEEWNAGRCLAITLYFVEEIFGIKPTGRITEAASSNLAHGIYTAAREAIVTAPGGHSAMTRNISELFGRGTLRSKAEILRRRLFLRPEEFAAMYPVADASGGSLYSYVRRLKDLAARYGKTFIALIRRDPGVKQTLRNTEQALMIADWLSAKSSGKTVSE